MSRRKEWQSWRCFDKGALRQCRLQHHINVSNTRPRAIRRCSDPGVYPSGVRANRRVHVQELAVAVAFVVGINITEIFGSLVFCYILFFRLRHDSSNLTMQLIQVNELKYIGCSSGFNRAACSVHPLTKCASLLFWSDVGAHCKHNASRAGQEIGCKEKIRREEKE